MSEPSNRAKRTELLILCQLFYPELVSTGQTLTELAEQLTSLGVDVEVLCGRPTILGRKEKIPRRLEHQGIRIRRLWGTQFPKLSLIGRIVNQVTFAASAFLYLLFHPPQKPILVLTNPPFLAIGCALLKWLGLGAPFVYLVFDVYPDTAVQLGVLRRRSLLVRLWERLNLTVCRQASSVVVIGRCMKNVINEKLTRGGLFLNGRLQYIPIWCDDAGIGSSGRAPDSFAEEFQVRGKFVVGYFGNMGRFHDMETIMKAAELLRDERDITFLFVGEGHKKQWALNYAGSRGLSNCRFHGYVSREKLGLLLSLADLGLVALSEGQEGLSVPSKTLGLMAARVPVLAVVPSACEIARIVREEDCGCWIRPGDANELAGRIMELRDRGEVRCAMGMNGARAIQKKYSLAYISRQYADLVARVVSEAKARHPVVSPHTEPSEC